MMKKTSLLTIQILLVTLFCQICYPLGKSESKEKKSKCIKPQCGQYCAYHVCQLLGVPISLQQVSQVMPPKKQGESMLEIAQFLKRCGLDCSGKNVSFEELAKGPFPVIAHMITTTKSGAKEPHFLVIEFADSSKVKILDGFGKRGMLPAKTFLNEWDGNILIATRPQGKLRRPNFINRAGKTSSWLQFDTLFIDAGDIPQENDGYLFVFSFKNLGTDDLHIQKVKTNCGCTNIENSFDKVILPGETSKISIRYEFGESRGKFGQSAIIKSDDPYFPYIKLNLAGNGMQEVRVVPSRLSFGKVVQGESVIGRCFITYTGDSVFEIKSTKTDAECLTVSIEPLIPRLIQKLDPRMGGISISECHNRFMVEGQIDTAKMDIGKPKINLEINTNLSDFSKILIPVDLTIIPVVKATPSKLFLGEIIEGSSVNETVTIKSLNGSPLRVNKVDLKDTGLKCLYSPDSLEIIKFRFTGQIFNARQIEDKKISIVLTESDSDKSFTIELPISALFTERQNI